MSITEYDVAAVESRGGTWLRVTHADGTVADHDFRDHVHGKGVWASFTAETIAAARAIHGTVAWIIDGEVIDTAPDGLWDHTRGRCTGGTCGWTPEDTEVIFLPPVTVADLITQLQTMPQDAPVLLPAVTPGSGYSRICSVATRRALELRGRPRGEGQFAHPETARDDATRNEDIDVVGDEFTAVTLDRTE